jgi:hypothetical protein
LAGNGTSSTDTVGKLLRAVVAGAAAIQLFFILTRQACWNTKVLLALQQALRKCGVAADGHRFNMLQTPMHQYWRLLCEIPGLASDDAAVWRQRLTEWREELRRQPGRTDAQQRCLTGEELRKLQRDLIRRVFRERLNLELPQEHASAFGLYRRSSDALRDFLDYCLARGYLVSRETAISAVPGFVSIVREWNTTRRIQPPPDFFLNRGASSTYSTKHLRFRTPKAFGDIFWGKAHFKRINQTVRLPLLAQEVFNKSVTPPSKYPRHYLRAALTYEMCIQGCKKMASLQDALANVDERPDVVDLLAQAGRQLLAGATVSTGRVAPPSHPSAHAPLA